MKAKAATASYCVHGGGNASLLRRDTRNCLAGGSGTVPDVITRRDTCSDRLHPHCHPQRIGTPTPYQNQTAIQFFHEFIPPTATAQTRRHTSRGTYLPAATARAAALLRAVMEPHAPPTPLAGPLSVGLLWTWPGKVLAWKVTRPDGDNVSKMALDAMGKAGFFFDDAQVVDLHVCKFLGPIPGISVTVSPARNLADDV